jgi:hypothetical protein
MSQFNQIRECFLTNARQHLLAPVATVAENSGDPGQNNQDFYSIDTRSCLGKAEV